jgi:hypothetical protein
MFDFCSEEGVKRQSSREEKLKCPRKKNSQKRKSELTASPSLPSLFPYFCYAAAGNLDDAQEHANSCRRGADTAAAGAGGNRERGVAGERSDKSEKRNASDVWPPLSVLKSPSRSKFLSFSRSSFPPTGIELFVPLHSIVRVQESTKSSTRAPWRPARRLQSKRHSFFCFPSTSSPPSPSLPLFLFLFPFLPSPQPPR